MRKLLELLFGKPSLPIFRYKYLRHPFDDWQHFEVKAEDQKAGDSAAIAQYTQMFENGQTTMLEFHPA